MKPYFLLFLLAACSSLWGQNNSGLLTGNIQNENHKPVEGATVQLIRLQNSETIKTTITDINGSFSLTSIPFDYYRLQVSFVGLQTLTMDSLYFRAERSDFNLADLIMKPGGASSNLGEVIIYAEKPLIQSKDGNITFNAGESALSAGGTASDLLTSVPLITKDADGKVLVKGKEPKILIDDKPVELNMQQLQDLLESMPGSSIEKIEVLTNPPPQYANEQGGVINIVLKKGKIGLNGRLSVYAGTRGEKGTNASFNYRRSGLAVHVNAGVSSNDFAGNGRSIRQNIYPDSTNHFNTTSEYNNKNLRPNFRASVDYDINKQHALNFVMQYNSGDLRNHSYTQYRNINRFEELYNLSTRDLNGHVQNQNMDFSLNYTLRTKKPGEVLRIFSNVNFYKNDNDRDFLQSFFTPDFVYLNDSLRLQNNNDRNKNYNIRVNYDVPLSSKTSLSFGSFLNATESHQILDAAYKQKPGGEIVRSELLSNDFLFKQKISNVRAAFRQNIIPDLRVTAGLALENTAFSFDLYKTDSLAKNQYLDYLPFVSISKTWNEDLNLRLAYRKSIRRPGIWELNPSIDNADPYNIRFGNPNLEASTAHNFDLTLGKTTNIFYANVGLGYNVVKDIFSQLRTPVSDSKTEITWQNISGRKEYEINSWNGYTINKKLRLNLSAGYTYNQYSSYDKEVRKFRNGGSFTSNLNSNYSFNEALNATTNFTFNRFANPQGTVRGSLSFNLGLQAKWFQRKLVTTINIIDPFNQQEYRTYTIGPNFSQENFNSTRTRNFRLSIGYNFSNAPKKKSKGKEIDKSQLQNMLKK